MQIGLVLEEVEMSPLHLFGVVGRAIGSTTARAGEAAVGGEVYVDVQATGHCVEVAPDDRPWWRDAQRQLQQAGVAHVAFSAIDPLRACRRARRRQNATRRSAMACGHP
jgi:hypothetical protein